MFLYWKCKECGAVIPRVNGTRAEDIDFHFRGDEPVGIHTPCGTQLTPMKCDYGNVIETGVEDVQLKSCGWEVK